ncbi:MAG: VWA domain-containing protein [Acidimicrobiales bacterium]|nr:VWA domain-containing protein [Acidimicrobiales bacterium]
MQRSATMVDRVVRLIGELRAEKVPVSLAETLDSVIALGQVDLADRSQVRTALAATLVKRPQHLDCFDAAFDRAFAQVSPGLEAMLADREGFDADEWSDALLLALTGGDAAALPGLADRAVGALSGIGDEARSGSAERATAGFYLNRVLHQLDLSLVLQRAIRQKLRKGETPLEARLQVDQLRAGMDQLQQLLSSRVRRRLGPGGAGSPAHRLDEVGFLEASTSELAAMRLAVAPLARALSRQLRRERRSGRSGRLDFRRTIRSSVSSGGVPLQAVLRRRHPRRPELFVLCDLSGSVAEFAGFLLTLLHALHEELPRLRTFVFVDGVDEVTGVLTANTSTIDPRHLLEGTRAVEEGHSDYGSALRQFASRYGTALGPASTVLMAGDGRTNHRDPGFDVLADIAARTRRVIWLNPEARERWDRGDSAMAGYAPLCSSVHEVSNLAQLSEVVRVVARHQGR